MIFTSFTYLYFFAAVFALYWAIKNTKAQNILLLVSSYFFYGYVHPWFCLLIALSTVVDYSTVRLMMTYPSKKKLFLVVSLVFNLGLLGTFKYFNFFIENFQTAFAALGFNMDPIVLRLFLPAGISFYTFQSLSYAIDVYRGQLKGRKSLLNYATFVAFFPQLVAGPIERATDLLPLVEKKRTWKWEYVAFAAPLIIRGYLKKLVIADNVAVYVNKIFMLESPSVLMLAAGALAFAVQIFADFSAYTDIARGSAKLLGFNLMENFKSPYIAISPSDFWRRWHISFSSWIRDYLYIPLGGSKVVGQWRFFCVVVTSMGLSGLWHGAAWNYVLWGVFHGVLLFAYHAAGKGGRWQPKGAINVAVAWAVMFSFTLFGWLLFRADSMAWLLKAIGRFDVGFYGHQGVAAVTTMGLTLLYASPLLVLMIIDRFVGQKRWARASYYAFAALLILVFHTDSQQDFIYFQF